MGQEISCDDNTTFNTCSEEKPLYCTLQGLKDNPKECGCPSGKREYDNKCIPIIKCSDGTLEYDCSSKIEMQCIDNKLVYNPQKCGCPENFVKRSNTCVKTCTNGTAYNECSDNKPKFCDNGNLINKASECGCSGNYYPYKEDCIEKNRLIELKILYYTNIERKNAGLNELIWDEQLGQIARSHSEDMVKNNFFDHVNLRGEDPTARAKKAGFNRIKQLGGGWYTDGVAENIGEMPTGNVVGIGYVSNDVDSVAKAQVYSWMESSGHRANLLNNQHTYLGVGIAYDGLYYFSTQDFG